jgi:hypothetical protein
MTETAGSLLHDKVAMQPSGRARCRSRPGGVNNLIGEQATCTVITRDTRSDLTLHIDVPTPLGWIILKWIPRIWEYNADTMYVADDSHRWAEL